TRFPGQPKVKYRVAVVEVNDAILGTRDKKIRVGFVPPAAGGGGPIRRFPAVDLKEGQENIFLLVKHPEERFFVASNSFDVVSKASGIYENKLKLNKQYAQLLEEQKKSLKSKTAEDLFLTAALLISRYRTQKPFVATQKTEPIDAAES